MSHLSSPADQPTTLHDRMGRFARSLRGQYLAVAGMVLASCVVLFAALWEARVEKTFIAMRIEESREEMEVLARAILPYLLQNQVGAIHEVMDLRLQRSDDWISLRLTDAEGKRLFPLREPPPQVQENGADVSVPIRLGERTVGRLHAVLDTRVAAQKLHVAIFPIEIFIFGFLSMSAIFLFFVLDRLILRRVTQLSHAARDLASGLYDTTLPRRSRDEIGDLVESFTTMREQIKSKERSLIEARDVAEAAVEAKSRFLASMSHEIRTPLNGILPVADTLLADSLTQDQREQVSIIRNAGRTLKSVIDDILDISKLEAGEVLIREGEIALRDVIRDTASVLLPQARMTGLALEAIFAPELPDRVLGDADRLAQVLLNLLGNAVKFTKEGSVRLVVAPDPDQVPNAVDHMALRFAVSDTGIGVAAEDRARIFERFAQVDNRCNRQFAGSGLGLPISAALVEAMGGKLLLDSVEGQGSTFWFTLSMPVVASAPPAENHTDTSASQPTTGNPGTSRSPKPGAKSRIDGPGSALAGGQLRVLIVDDSRVNLTVARAMLTRFGHLAEVAETGGDAINQVAAGGIDLVLMDQHMPGMDGLEATRRIRQLPDAVSDVMISGLTASIFPEDIANCFGAGMDEFLAKPISRKDLADLLNLCQVRKAGLPDIAAETPWTVQPSGDRDTEAKSG